MSSTTPNIGLTKTTASETIGQQWAASNDSGGNFDIIDTKMGAVGNKSLQTQVTELSSQTAKMVSLGTSASGSPVSVTVGGGTRALIVGVSPANNSKFLVGIYATNGGAITVDDFVSGSNMSTTTGTNSLTISNTSSNGCILFAIVFAGSISV